MEPGGKVSVLATCTLCLMYSTAKVGKCQLVKWITYITFAGIYFPLLPLCAGFAMEKVVFSGKKNVPYLEWLVAGSAGVQTGSRQL